MFVSRSDLVPQTWVNIMKRDPVALPCTDVLGRYVTGPPRGQTLFRHINFPLPEGAEHHGIPHNVTDRGGQLCDVTAQYYFCRRMANGIMRETRRDGTESDPKSE